MRSPFLGSGGFGYDSVWARTGPALKRKCTQLKTGATCLPLISEVYQRGRCGRTDEGFPTVSINMIVRKPWRLRGQTSRPQQTKRRMPWVSGHPPRTATFVACFFALFSEGEEVKHVADSWAVQGDIWIGLLSDRVGEVIAAATGYWRQFPIGLDEFEYRNMIGICVRDVAGFGVWRNHQSWNPGSISEEIERLDVAGIVVTSTLVEGNDDGGALPQRLVGLDFVDDLLHKTFEQVEFGRSRVTIEPAIRLHERNRGQGTVLDCLI